VGIDVRQGELLAEQILNKDESDLLAGSQIKLNNKIVFVLVQVLKEIQYATVEESRKEKKCSQMHFI